MYFICPMLHFNFSPWVEYLVTTTLDEKDSRKSDAVPAEGQKIWGCTCQDNVSWRNWFTYYFWKNMVVQLQPPQHPLFRLPYSYMNMCLTARNTQASHNLTSNLSRGMQNSTSHYSPAFIESQTTIRTVKRCFARQNSGTYSVAFIAGVQFRNALL